MYESSKDGGRVITFPNECEVGELEGRVAAGADLHRYAQHCEGE